MKASHMFTFINGYKMDFILCYQSSEADVSDCRKMSSDFITFTGKLMGNETLYQTLTYAMLLGLSVNTFYFINH